MNFWRQIESGGRATVLKQLGILTKEQRQQLLEDLDKQLLNKADEKVVLIRDLLVDCINKRDKE